MKGQHQKGFRSQPVRRPEMGSWASEERHATPPSDCRTNWSRNPRTVGPRIEQNPHTAELAAIATAVAYPPVAVHNRTITILSSNQAASLTIGHPRQQSGQRSIKQIYRGIRALRDRGNTVQGHWLPSQRNLDVSGWAKSAAKKATEPGKAPEDPSAQAKATILNEMRRGIRAGVVLPEGIGKHARDVDTALPGKHTKAMYDPLNKRRPAYWHSLNGDGQDQ